MRAPLASLLTLGLTGLTAMALGPAPPGEPPPKRPPGSSLVLPGRDKPSGPRPADLSSLRRLVRQFDFEDPERFPTEMPRDWYRLLTTASGRPGFPDFGTISLSDSVAREGKWSLQYKVVGGSMSTALPPGIIRIFPGSRYRMSVWVRSEGLQHATLRMIARLHDRDGRATGDEYETTPLRSEGEWTQVRIDLPEVPAYASDMSIELELTQPSTPQSATEHRLTDDITGSAWFDDLEIWQIPSIRFGSTNAAQVFAGDGPREIEIELRDLVSDELTADIVLRDIDGAVVHSARMPLPGAGALVKVPLPPVEPGAYTASLAVAADGIVLARRTIDIAVLDGGRDDRARGTVPRFGVLLPPVQDAELPLLRTIARELDPDFVIVPAWPNDFDVARIDSRIAAMREFLDSLLDRRVEPMLAITSVPPALAAPRHLDRWQALAYFGADDAVSRANLEPWLLAFGQHVERWQIGDVRGEAVQRPLDRDQAVRIRSMLDERVAGPVLLAPAEADRDDAPPPPGIARHVRIPWSARPADMASYVEQWRDAETVVAFELAPESITDRVRIDDLTLRALHAWRIGVRTMAIDLAWKPANVADSRPPSLRGESIAWREIGRALSGRTFAGELVLPPGLHGWLAEGTSPAVILWSDDAQGATTPLTMLLSNGPVTASDPFGRRTTLSPGPGGHVIAVSPTPQVVEGVDFPLMKLLATAHLEPHTLESRRSPQNAVVVIRNTFPVSMSGTLSIADQPNWDIAPRQQQFSIPPGGEGRIPLSIALPRSTTAGDHELLAKLEWVAGENYTTSVPLRMKVDWSDVDVRSSWRFARSVETGRIDVVVTVSVTNRGTASLDLEAFALARDYTQTRRPILKLGPGETAMRVFPFSDGARRLSGVSLIAGVSEMDGERRLTEQIAIPPLLPRLYESTQADASPQE